MLHLASISPPGNIAKKMKLLPLLFLLAATKFAIAKSLATSIQMACLTRFEAYLDIVPARVKGKDNAVLFYVLLDSRSDKTFCECGIVNKLRV